MSDKEIIKTLLNVIGRDLELDVAIKDLFFEPDEWVVQFHPARSEYVNNVPNCLHLWRPIKEEMPKPPSILVGVKGVEFKGR